MRRTVNVIQRLVWVVPVCICLAIGAPVRAQRADGYEVARQAMVQREVVGRGVRDPRVADALGEVPRHLFLPADLRAQAYLDAALPIGNGQTITSPYTVAFMTAQLEPQASDRVLEIGTGSGYQAAVLSHLVADVYTIEIVEPLGRRAKSLLQRLGYRNVHVKIGDGYQGWPERAPFDKIIVTCSPENVPQALVDQLREGGRLVIPLGERFQQALYLFRKVNGQLQQERLEPTFFVPMTGQAEAERAAKGEEVLPQLINGSFEESEAGKEPRGWFYVQQADVVRDPTAPDGRQVLVLRNMDPGRNAHVLQAVGVDGQRVRNVAVSLYRRTKGIESHQNPDWQPRVDLTFYGEDRAAIRTATLGPWSTDSGWTAEGVDVAVPGRCRFAVVVVSLFGATGELAVDQLAVTASARRDRESDGDP
jgi:protein-L-isoaspartate(D-aspartate) O-methyltransferase